MNPRLESIKDKALALRNNKALAFGMVACAGVMAFSVASGAASALEDPNATTAQTVYYGMEVFEWVCAGIALIGIFLGIYLKNFYALIVGALAMIITAWSYLGA